MTFLNPGILFGLFAIAIPILIHILNLNKVRKVEFSTLMFLKELQKTKLRRIRLEQLLLLALRILMIIFLVFSFAKPVYKGYAGDSGAVRKTAVIIIDNSFSMNVGTPSGDFLLKAKELSKEILTSFSQSDEVYIIPASSIGMSDYSPITGNISDLIDSIGNLEFGYKSLDYNSAVIEAGLIIFNSDNFLNEVFIISDFQSSNFSPTTINSNLPESSDKNSVLYLIDVNSRKPNDLEISNVTLKTGIILPGREVRVSALVNNFSDFNVSNVNVVLILDGQFISEKYIDIGSNSAVETEFVMKLNSAGYVNGKIEITNTEFSQDELPQNNTAYFSLFVPDELNVTLMESGNADFSFVNAALASSLPEDLSQGNILSREIQNVGLLREVDNVLFLSSIQMIDDDEAIRYRNFIEDGGGLIIFPNAETDLNSLNRFLQSINAPEVSSIDVPTQTMSLKATDRSHPVLADIFSEESFETEIESPSFRSYAKIIPSANSRVILELSSGEPFLIESGFGRGRVLIYAVTPDLAMSDFPLKSIFAPLIVRGSFYAGNDLTPNIGHTIGGSNLIDLRKLENISGLVLPGNKIINKSEFEDKTGIVLESRLMMFPYSSMTAEPGSYSIFSQTDTVSISINPKAQEGNLSKPEESEIENRFSDSGFNEVIYSDETFDKNSLQQYRSGIDIWWLFLILALLCVAAEMIISRRLQE